VAQNSLIFIGYWGLFPVEKRLEVQITNHLLLIQKLRMNGAVYMLPLYAFIKCIDTLPFCHPLSLVLV
jgi:hypothetical protein